MYLFLLFSPFSTDPPFLSISCYCTHVDRHVTGGRHGHLGLCFIGERVCGRLECVGVKFGTGRGIVEWLGVCGGGRGHFWGLVASDRSGGRDEGAHSSVTFTSY